MTMTISRAAMDALREFVGSSDREARSDHLRFGPLRYDETVGESARTVCNQASTKQAMCDELRAILDRCTVVDPGTNDFDAWRSSLSADQRYDFDSEGRGYPKDRGVLMKMAWNAALAYSAPPTASAEAQTENDAGLLPCPFCGGSDRISIREQVGDVCFHVECVNCDSRTTACRRLADAVNAWNRRASTTPALREVTDEDVGAADWAYYAVAKRHPVTQALRAALKSFRARLSTAQGVPEAP